jgi:hypothetical protein
MAGVNMIKRARGKNLYTSDGDVCKIAIFGVNHVYRGEAIIDVENIDKCKQEKWFIKMRNGLPMCVCGHINGERNVRMHHFLFCNPPTGMEYDHINRNPLDNRQSNLRICTDEQNQWNRGLLRRNISGAKGVRRSATKRESWTALIWHNRKPVHIGSYPQKELAIEAYNMKAKELKGEFAYINQTGGA